MLNKKRLMVVMPAYRAAKTVEATWRGLPHDIVDRTLLVDDASNDETVEIARELGLDVLTHESNRGYGANQKTCYHAALDDGADIIVMVHPDYQYDPRLVTAMAAMVESDIYDIVIGSRITGGGALRGGMPIWKYVANRGLTAFQNLLLGAKLSEYHSGYRAYSRQVLQTLNWEENSDDFVFDNQFLVQGILAGFRMGEISVPTRYFEAASSINFKRSVRYGLGVLGASVAGLLKRLNIYRGRLFRPPGNARS
ncbi:MAG: glycosyltransferase family 2 protein [Lysobacterales bacterium]|jgi:glycosyltransferase involved in cell wall biosynthesis